MIFLIIATAMVFGYFLGISRIPAQVSDFILSLASYPGFTFSWEY